MLIAIVKRYRVSLTIAFICENINFNFPIGRKVSYASQAKFLIGIEMQKSMAELARVNKMFSSQVSFKILVVSSQGGFENSCYVQPVEF